MDRYRTVNDHLDFFVNALDFVIHVLYLDTYFLRCVFTIWVYKCEKGSTIDRTGLAYHQ